MFVMNYNALNPTSKLQSLSDTATSLTQLLCMLSIQACQAIFITWYDQNFLFDPFVEMYCIHEKLLRVTLCNRFRRI
jgi:hypothetical protein